MNYFTQRLEEEVLKSFFSTLGVGPTNDGTQFLTPFLHRHAFYY